MSLVRGRLRFGGLLSAFGGQHIEVSSEISCSHELDKSANVHRIFHGKVNIITSLCPVSTTIFFRIGRKSIKIEFLSENLEDNLRYHQTPDNLNYLLSTECDDEV